MLFLCPPLKRDSMQEVELERRARGGDSGAFGQLLRAWDHDLRGVAWSVVRDQHQVDDIMQEAYEKAFRAIKSFDGRSSMKTWLHTIVYRRAIDYVRYEGRRRHDSLAEVIELPLAGAQDMGDRVLSGIDARKALESVDPEHRALLYYTTALGYSFDETAEITGVARGTVASRVGRAKKKLRKRTAS